MHEIDTEEQQAFAFKENIKRTLKERLPKIKIGNLEIETDTLESIYHFHPYFPYCDELFPLTKKDIKEVSDPAQRLAVIQNSIKVAQEIVKALFVEEKNPDDQEEAALLGKCATTSGIAQELMALSGVRSIIMNGTFDAEYTERFKRDSAKTPSQDKLYGHFWLYAFTDVTTPLRTHSKLTSKLLLIDPTRIQFEQEKDSITNPEDKRYAPFNIPPNIDDTYMDKVSTLFTEMNSALWTDEELDDWKMILEKSTGTTYGYLQRAA